MSLSIFAILLLSPDPLVDPPPPVPPPRVVELGPATASAHACPCRPACNCNPCRCNDVAALEVKAAGLETAYAQMTRLAVAKANEAADLGASRDRKTNRRESAPPRPAGKPVDLTPADPAHPPGRVWVINEDRYGWGLIRDGYFIARYGDNPGVFDSGPKPKMVMPPARPPPPASRVAPPRSSCSSGRCPR